MFFDQLSLDCCIGKNSISVLLVYFSFFKTVQTLLLKISDPWGKRKPKSHGVFSLFVPFYPISKRTLFETLRYLPVSAHKETLQVVLPAGLVTIESYFAVSTNRLTQPPPFSKPQDQPSCLPDSVLPVDSFPALARNTGTWQRDDVREMTRCCGLRSTTNMQCGRLA